MHASSPSIAANEKVRCQSAFARIGAERHVLRDNARVEEISRIGHKTARNALDLLDQFVVRGRRADVVRRGALGCRAGEGDELINTCVTETLNCGRPMTVEGG